MDYISVFLTRDYGGGNGLGGNAAGAGDGRDILDEINVILRESPLLEYMRTI